MQQMRNAEFEALRRQKGEMARKRQEYVDQLSSQIEDKKKRVFLSREEFKRDKQMVNEVVERIVREEVE